MRSDAPSRGRAGRPVPDATSDPFECVALAEAIAQTTRTRFNGFNLLAAQLGDDRGAPRDVGRVDSRASNADVDPRSIARRRARPVERPARHPVAEGGQRRSRRLRDSLSRARVETDLVDALFAMLADRVGRLRRCEPAVRPASRSTSNVRCPPRSSACPATARGVDRASGRWRHGTHDLRRTTPRTRTSPVARVRPVHRRATIRHSRSTSAARAS